MTKKKKKGHQKFWEIDDNFGGNIEIFLETPKKGGSKISAKIWPPNSEVLDPLVDGKKLNIIGIATNESVEINQSRDPRRSLLCLGSLAWFPTAPALSEPFSNDASEPHMESILVGLGGTRSTDFGVNGSLGTWDLREILVYLIMYRNVRWEDFPKWVLIRNKKICVY